MRLYAGTSGFSYDEWKGVFYPEDLPSGERLSFYAERLPAVEINNTFYRLPKKGVLESWASQVPEGFRFVLKASRRITHQKKLADAGSEMEFLLGNVTALGDRLGALLFQLPPYLRRDLPRLAGFLELLPEGTRAAFEFRHHSWADAEVRDLLAARGCALVVGETDEEPEAEIVPTASWGLLRLRRCDYTDNELAIRAERVAAAGWDEAYVFFKHEDEAAGPAMALRFLELAGAGPRADAG
jgi:uncharacterized protein YecE (DUF72 family)